ncbi:hypothetical protein HaLaN_03592, partial [Haematococcus lacustris]
MRLHGAQEKVLERYFRKLEEEAASVSQQQWGARKQLVVFFGNAGIGTRSGWGAKAVLQACRKVVERPNSGKPLDRVPGKVVTVDELRTSRVSSIMNSPQPCEEELDSSKPTRPTDWKPKPGQGLQRSPQPPAGRGKQVAPTGAVQVATPRKASTQGQGVPSIGVQEAARPSTQGPSPAACSTVACVHRAMLELLLTSEHVAVTQFGLQITQPLPISRGIMYCDVHAKRVLGAPPFSRCEPSCKQAKADGSISMRPAAATPHGTLDSWLLHGLTSEAGTKL